MLSLDFSVVPEAVPALITGLGFSLELTVVAMVGGVIIGTLLALARLSGNAVLGTFAKIYVDLMRSIPLLMMILWFYLLVPLMTGTHMGPENSALITFTLFQAAFYSEIMRAGIQSIPKGQINAGFAIGM
jgi:glutamate/aspartate transport system permease protein